MNDPELSVVIPAHDVEATLGEQLDALLGQTWDGDWEIVVVDNLSTDGTAALVHQYAARDDRVRLVAAPERPGVGYVRNTGIAKARGRAVAICDGDDVVGAGWVAAMGDALRRARYVTGPLEVDRLNSGVVAGSRGRNWALAPGDFFGVFPFANGGNLGVHRSVVEEFGGFDDSFLYGEDIEFGLRLWNAGIGLRFEEAAVLHVRYHDDARGLWRQAVQFGRVKPQIARALSECTGRRAPRLRGVRTWGWLVAHLPDLADDAMRSRWLWTAGNRLGQIEGSVQHRFVLL